MKYFVLLACCLLACQTQRASQSTTTPVVFRGSVPDWLFQTREGEWVCGVGAAGASFFSESPYPQDLSKQRAVENVAGLFATHIQEAFFEQQSMSQYEQRIELERVATLDDDLVHSILTQAKVLYWRDAEGVGPFHQKDFTYARACVLPSSILPLSYEFLDMSQFEKNKPFDVAVPAWLTQAEPIEHHCLCAIGFSEPAFFCEQTFENVQTDVRTQLSKNLQTLVASSSLDHTTEQGLWLENLTAAVSEALSQGVLMTDYWFDEQGRGPHRIAKSTYGRGCVCQL